MTNYLVWANRIEEEEHMRCLRLYLLKDASFVVRSKVGSRNPIDLYIPEFEEMYLNSEEYSIPAEPWNSIKNRFGEFLIPELRGKLTASIPLINLCAQESERYNGEILYYDDKVHTFDLSNLNEVHSRYDPGDTNRSCLFPENFGFCVSKEGKVEKLIREHLS